jgi:hypothetical protein
MLKLLNGALADARVKVFIFDDIEEMGNWIIGK